MAIDIFTTREMLSVINEIFPARTFLADTYFAATQIHDTEFVDIDIVKGRRKMAPFVSPMHEGHVMTREGYTTQTFKPAYVKPKMVSTAADFLKRQPGENLFSNMNRAQRAAAMMASDLALMDEYITRREEWMCAQLLNTGTVHVVGDGVDVTIDLNLDSSHVLTPGDLAGGVDWLDTDATPLDDLDAIQLLISQDSGLTCNRFLLATDAWLAFIKHAQVRGEWLPAGGQAIGSNFVRGDNFEGAIFQGLARNKAIWTYNEQYIDDDGSVKSMIQSKKVIAAAEGARSVRHYGAIMDLSAPGGASLRRFPKSWEEQDPSVRYVMVQSAPLPVFHQIDGLVIATVLD